MTQHPGLKIEAEQRRKDIEDFLLGEVRNGRHYFKAIDIAEAVGLSVRSVGSNIGIIKKTSQRLTIIRWSSSSSTVWRVTEAAAENVSDVSENRINR